MTTSALRTACEGMLFDGTAGGYHTITATHFHRPPPDRDVDDQDEGVLERAAWISLADREPLEGYVDPLRAYGLYRYPLEVRVGYVQTGAGGDTPERAGQISGSGDSDAIEDRSQADRHEIEAALSGSSGGWSSLDPHVIDCRPTGGGLEMISDTRAVLTVTFDLWARAALPGSYGPSL